MESLFSGRWLGILILFVMKVFLMEICISLQHLTGSMFLLLHAVISRLALFPFAAVDSTFSCEITGGEEDGYAVGFERAAVQVRPRPTVSIEDRGARRVVDGL